MLERVSACLHRYSAGLLWDKQFHEKCEGTHMINSPIKAGVEIPMWRNLPESTLPPGYTTLFNNYMRPSQNLPLPPRIPPPLFNNYNFMRRSQNLPLLPFLQQFLIFKESTFQSLNISFSRTTCICETYHSLPELKNILGGRGRFWKCRI